MPPDPRTRICSCPEELPEEWAPFSDMHEHGCGVYHAGAECSMTDGKLPFREEEDR